MKKLTTLPRQNKISYGSDKDIPRLLWNNGITNLTDLTAFHKVGIMFTIVIISLQEEGNVFLNNVFSDSQETKNMRECFQMLLCYWMWLKKDKYWKRNDGHAFAETLGAIRLMLMKIKSLWPRTEGQGWNIPKFHEQLHVPDDILQNGSPAGTHSGPVEHNHIHFVKRLSRRTQRKGKLLIIKLHQGLIKMI